MRFFALKNFGVQREKGRMIWGQFLNFKKGRTILWNIFVSQNQTKFQNFHMRAMSSVLQSFEVQKIIVGLKIKIFF